MSMVFIAFLIDYVYAKTIGNIFSSCFQFIDNCIIGKNLAPIFDTKDKMIIQRIYRMRTFIKNVFHANIITYIFGLSSKKYNQFIPDLSKIGLGTSWG